MKTLRYTVRRGKDSGIHLWPHRFEDGQYVVSPTRFEEDYVRVPTLEALIACWRNGFKIRMSNLSERSRSGASLIEPGNIEIVED